MSGVLVKFFLTAAIGAVCAVAAYIATRPPVHAQGHHYGRGPVRRRPRSPSPPRRPPSPCPSNHSDDDDEWDNEAFWTPPEHLRRRGQQQPGNASDKKGSSCKICLDAFEDLTGDQEIVSTSCGHIFCKPCISQSLNSQKKCPTCREIISVYDLRRVYL